MQSKWGPTYCVFWVLFLFTYSISLGSSPPRATFQPDGSLILVDAKGSIQEFVKEGTPRQSIQIDGQSCNVSYGFNSAGKKTVLIGVPGSAVEPVVFLLDSYEITIPPKSALRLALNEQNRMEKMDSNPAETVRFKAIRLDPDATVSAPPPAPTQSSPIPAASTSSAFPASETAPGPTRPLDSSALTATPQPSPQASPMPAQPTPLDGNQPNQASSDWPGQLLEAPIPASLIEEEMFFARTELGLRFMSSLSLVTISGPQAGLGNYVQKQFAFGTGYRQDFDVGVQLIDWFGLSFESGFALNSIRGNTQGMNISDGTFWTFPFLAQLCFQYPNESGWIPYLNFGFGGAVTVLKLGQVTYANAPSISGTGNCVTNAYQISAGVRYRLYEDLSITLGYKFFGNSQGTVNLNNGVQLGLGSPVTNSAEVGVNFAF